MEQDKWPRVKSAGMFKVIQCPKVYSLEEYRDLVRLEKAYSGRKQLFYQYLTDFGR